MLAWGVAAFVDLYGWGANNASYIDMAPVASAVGGSVALFVLGAVGVMVAGARRLELASPPRAIACAREIDLPRGFPCRQHAEGEARDDCENRREYQDANVHLWRSGDWQRERNQLREQWQREIGDSDAEDSTDAGKEKRLRHRLTHESLASAAECGPYDDFPAAGERSGEKKIGEVRAGDEQYARGGAAQCEQ